MYKIILLAVFALGCVQGSPQANQYFDTMLHNAYPNEVRYTALDPARMQNFNIEFKDKVVFVTVKGKANFTNGLLNGLATARRYGQCQGPGYSFAQKTYNCTIIFSNLHANYSGTLKYGKVPAVDIKGTSDISGTTVFVEVFQNALAMPVLNKFVFKEAGIQKVNFTGLGPLNKYTKFLNDGFKAHVQAQAFHFINQQARYALQTAVSKVPLP